MSTKRIVNKVPGDVLGESKKERQGYFGKLSDKTMPQLNELLERQNKLLTNKSFINKLADKGEKIKTLAANIQQEIQKRSNEDNLPNMLSTLNLNPKDDLDALEWSGRCAPGHLTTKEDKPSDDDNDETNPLKILATHSGAGFHQKKHKIVKSEDPLIKLSDLDDSNDVGIRNEVKEEVIEEYAKHLCEKMDFQTHCSESNTKFLPYKTLRPSKVTMKVDKKANSHWEVTAATPPTPVYGDTRLVSLQESIKLQYDQHEKLKEIQIKRAAVHLAESQHMSIGPPLHYSGSYRDDASASNSSTDDELSEHEVHDDEGPDSGGVIVYNVVDDGND